MKSILKLSVIIAIVITISSCSFIKKTEKLAEYKIQSTVNKQEVQQTNFSKYPTIEETINKLCSDEFEGRRTFSKGNEQAGEYIADIFKNIGLEPMSGESYFQKYTQSEPASKDYAAISKEVSNIVGYIKGKDSGKAVVISAHFDSLGIKEGNINRGALDNASGVAALIEIAKKLKEISTGKPFESNIIFCAFNGEEQLLVNQVHIRVQVVQLCSLNNAIYCSTGYCSSLCVAE